MRIQRRLEHLEAVLRPGIVVPSWSEYMEANERWLARGERDLRAHFGALLEEAGIEVNEETGSRIGLPGMWRASTIAANDALLADDTEEQGLVDEDVVIRWNRSQGYDRDTYIVDARGEREVDKIMNRLDQLLDEAAASKAGEQGTCAMGGEGAGEEEKI